MTPHLSGRRWQQNRFNWKDAAEAEGTCRNENMRQDSHVETEK